MGGGDLNMKKSWHPVLLVNQERVWKAEKAANEEKKALAQLRKEREEERQLAELQRMQEASTGRKRVEKLDWMYAASGNEGGALGGARISETMMEDYLLGKRRVDEVLAASDKNVGNTHKDFIAVQNANTARDTAAKIREDPLLAIRKQEEAALRAMANRPDIRRQLKAIKRGGSVEESKEERKARKRAEKEERRKDRHERRERRRDRDDSPRSDYSDDRDRRRSHGRDSEGRVKEESKRYRSRSRSSSPYARRRDESPRRRDRDDRDGYSRRHRDDSPRRDRKSDPRDDRDDRHDRDYRRSRDRDDHREPRVPPPRQYANGHSHSHASPHSNGHANGGRDAPHRPSHAGRPSAMDMSDRPTSSRPPPPPPASNTAGANPNGQSLDEQRAARLAAMSQNAHSMQDQRTQSLAARAEELRKEEERDMKMRARYGKEAANAGFFNQQRDLGLSEALSRRGGQGLQKDI